MVIYNYKIRVVNHFNQNCYMKKYAHFSEEILTFYCYNVNISRYKQM